MSVRTRAPLVLFPLLVVLAACASGGGDGGPRRDRNLITLEELEDLQQFTLLDAIRRLRPRWLQVSRAVNTRGNPQEFPRVIMDRIPQGELEALGQISVSDVLEVRFLSAADATLKYGTGYAAGAIEVTRR